MAPFLSFLSSFISNLSLGHESMSHLCIQPRLAFHVEGLEARKMLAGFVHVDFNPTTGILSIDGDEFSNAIRIEANRLASTTSLVISDDDGTTTLIANGLPSTLLAYELNPAVARLRISMGNGDDSVILENAVGEPVKAAKEVTIAGDAGADFIAVAGSPGAKITVGKSTVTGGADDDFMLLSNVCVEGNLSVQTNGGVDSIFVDAAEVERHASFDTSAADGPMGGDMVDLFDSLFHRRLNITTGVGDDVIDITRVTVGRNLNVDTGGGSDVVAVEISAFDRFKASLGAGNDLLDMESNAISKASRVITADGDDDVLLDDNHFQRALWVQMGVRDGGVDRFEGVNNEFSGGRAVGACATLLVMSGNVGRFQVTTEMC